MTPAVQFRPLLTVSEVADRLSVSIRTVRRRIDTGELPAVRLGSSPRAPLRVDPAELAAFVESHPAEAARTSHGSPHGGVLEAGA